MKKFYLFFCLAFLAFQSNACDTVTNVTINNITNSGANISWNAAASATYYEVWYRALPAGNWMSGTSSTTSKIIVGLQPFTTYAVAVKTFCSNVPSNLTSEYNFNTLNNGGGSNPTCDSILSLTLSNISATGAKATWNSVSGALWYNVYRRQLPGGSWIASTTSDTSKLFAGLIPNTPYEILVRSACSGDTSTNVNATPFTTDTMATTASSSCDSVSNLTISNITTTTAKLTWNAVTGSTWYNIYRRVLPSGSWVLSTTSDTTKLLSGLQPGTNYAVKVVTACNNLTSINVMETPFLTDTVVINPPSTCDSVSSVSFSNITNNGATVNWTSAIGAAYYLVYVRELPSGTWTMSTANGNSKVLSGLNQNTSYEVNVRTFCNPDSSQNLTTYSFTTSNIIVNPTPCDSVTNVSISNITDFDATVNWTAASGASWYHVVYRSLPSGTWNYLTASGTSKNINGLVPATNYAVIVRTFCGNDSSANIQTTNFTTTNTCSPPLNIWLEYDTAYAGVVTIHWTPSNIVDYSIVRFRELGASTWNTGTSNSANKTYSGLIPSKTYEYQVANVCNGTQGTFSSVYSFMINNLPLNVHNLSETAFNIFPNPADNELHVHSNRSLQEEFNVTILDMGGRTVLKKKASAKDFVVDIHSIQRGIYTIQFNGTNGYVYRAKFVKN